MLTERVAQGLVCDCTLATILQLGTPHRTLDALPDVTDRLTLEGEDVVIVEVPHLAQGLHGLDQGLCHWHPSYLFALLLQGLELDNFLARENNDTAGVDALPSLRSAAPETPVVFYIGQESTRGVPVGAFGITNRPDELLHLVLDVLERRRS